jgi:hypothetical protein
MDKDGFSIENDQIELESLFTLKEELFQLEEAIRAKVVSLAQQKNKSEGDLLIENADLHIPTNDEPFSSSFQDYSFALENLNLEQSKSVQQTRDKLIFILKKALLRMEKELISKESEASHYMEQIIRIEQEHKEESKYLAMLIENLQETIQILNQEKKLEKNKFQSLMSIDDQKREYPVEKQFNSTKEMSVSESQVKLHYFM